MDHFKLHSEYQPTGDQPQAIAELVEGFKKGNQFQTLLGVTGSGKTFTMANVIAALNKPTLVIAHNKMLAGQLYGEFKEFFPENAVEYFVSYYDYYQPEAYIPSSDTYIAKDSAINDEIDKLRLSATASLTERRDVVVVASVSCIYGFTWVAIESLGGSSCVSIQSVEKAVRVCNQLTVCGGNISCRTNGEQCYTLSSVSHTDICDSKMRLRSIVYYIEACHGASE